MVLLIGTFAFGAVGVPAETTGRPVRIVSVGFREGTRSLEEVCCVVDVEAAEGTDLIVLPETWRGHEAPLDTLEGPAVPALAALAQKHRTYIICPLDRMSGEKRLNSAIVLDRSGKVVCVYDKLFPYWAEFDVQPPIEPGEKGAVFQADFGKVGLAICFDVNFPEVWQQLADDGAELVVWPSAYSAGMSLQAHAINHHYYIVTATGLSDCLVYDITGENILSEKNEGLNVSRVTLDLDRGIYHENFNAARRDKLLREHPDDVVQEKWLQMEQWFVLKAKRPGVSARASAKAYGLEELRDYIARSRREIDKRRGWPFAETTRGGIK